MVYKQHFAAVLKHNGHILRDTNGDIRIPFGAEYSLLLKNLDSRRAVVSVSIDGQDVLHGRQLVINGNSDMELERFLENLTDGHRFKFIQKTAEIAEHRGDRIDDGIIRVEWRYELMPSPVTWTYSGTPRRHSLSEWVDGTDGRGPVRWMSASTTGAQHIPAGDVVASYTLQASSLGTPRPAPSEGITVGGSISQQHFYETSVGPLEMERHVLVLRLLGTTPAGVVRQPVTVRTRKRCVTCGRQAKSHQQFCGQCGTALDWGR
jgi:hypothetical protein